MPERLHHYQPADTGLRARPARPAALRGFSEAPASAPIRPRPHGGTVSVLPFHPSRTVPGSIGPTRRTSRGTPPSGHPRAPALLALVGALGLAAPVRAQISPPEAAPTAPVRLTAAQCASWSARSGFHSREELLQIVHAGALEGRIRHGYIDSTEIAALAGRIQSLVPLREVRRIEIVDSFIDIRFSRASSIVVPGTLRQARLSFPQRLRLVVRRVDTAALGIGVVSGALELHLSWLARRMTPLPATVRATELRYWCLPRRRSSGLELVEEREVRDARSASAGPGEKAIAYRDPFDGTARTFAVGERSLTLEGSRMAWAGKDSVLHDGKWRRDPQENRRMRESIARMQEAFSAGDARLYATVGMGGDLEHRKFHGSKGLALRSAKESR